MYVYQPLPQIPDLGIVFKCYVFGPVELGYGPEGDETQYV